MIFRFVSHISLVASFICLILNVRICFAVEDAPFTLDPNEYRSAIRCPRGIQNKQGGIVFLVHGTGTTGDESWVETPYNEKLASFGKGYDICWANLPDKALGDIQLSAEYLAHGIKYLAQRSPASSHRIHVLGHSQGGVNVQWALAFWPSIRPLVISFISLSSPFQGIEVSALRCPATKVFRTCVPAVLQLMADSKFMAALNSNKDSESGARALVPTTSIFSDYDLIIRLEGKNLNVSSWLSGATMIKIQNSTVCGKEHFTEHFEIMVDQAVFGLVSDAILHERPANISNFNEKLCHGQVKNLALNLHQVPKVLKAMFYSYFGDHKLEWFWNPYSHLALAYEPKLQPYVCRRGYAEQLDCQLFQGFKTSKFHRDDIKESL